MAPHADPEIILYDLACIKHVCFSPVVWRIRMMLNYKHVPYKTIFLEFQDIEPTLKPLGLQANESGPRYTVPAIHHAPTNTHLMGSRQIAEFIEATYPQHPIPLDSQHGANIETSARAMARGAYQLSSLAREPSILAPDTQAFFRRTREAALDQALALKADPAKEEQAWVEAADDMRAVSNLIVVNSAKGPFILGTRPSYTDFFIAGGLQSTRVIDEGLFDRMMQFDGFKAIYHACLPFMEKRD